MHSILDDLEKVRLVELATRRESAESEILATMEKLETENARIVDQIEQASEKLKALFREFEELKGPYAEHCRRQIQQNQQTLAPRQEESYPRWKSHSQFVVQTAVAAESKVPHSHFETIEEDSFRPNWSKKTSDDSQASVWETSRKSGTAEETNWYSKSEQNWYSNQTSSPPQSGWSETYSEQPVSIPVHLRSRMGGSSGIAPPTRNPVPRMFWE